MVSFSDALETFLIIMIRMLSQTYQREHRHVDLRPDQGSAVHTYKSMDPIRKHSLLYKSPSDHRRRRRMHDSAM